MTTPRSPVDSGSSFDMSAVASRSMLKEPIRLTLITLVEIRERHRAVAADHPLGDADAGAIHQHPRRAMRLGRRGDGGFGGGGIGDVAGHRHAADFGGHGFGELGVEVEDRDLGALRRQPARGAAPSPDAPPVTMAA